MMAKRSLPEIQSIAATATRIIRIRNETFCHSSTRICSAKLQADAARPDDADNGGRAGIQFDEVEHLPRKNGQHLRHQAEAYFMEMRCRRKP